MVSIKAPEMKTSFSLRRAAPVYLLASMQLVIFLGHAIAYSTEAGSAATAVSTLPCSRACSRFFNSGSRSSSAAS